MPRWRGCMPVSPIPVCPASRNRSERTRGHPMPRVAHNLSMMFNEVPFLDRFDAAAKARFTDDEFLYPCEHPDDGNDQSQLRNWPKNAMFNLSHAKWEAGEKGYS